MRVRHLFLSLITFFLVHSHGFGQDQTVNQTEKFIFYEVVIADSCAQGLLYHNALVWAKGNNIKIAAADSLQGVIRAENQFSVYKESGVLKKVSGKVSYNVMIEVKDNRYRYHFYDFVFHYYGPDRYHNIIPTGKKKKLEEPEAAGWQKLWNNHRARTTEKTQGDIGMLKNKIIEKPMVKPIVPPSKKEVKWD